MKITKIKRVGNKNLYHVYVDEQWAGTFLDEILVRSNLKTNMEIEPELFEKIKKENDEKVSFEMAATYLEKYIVSEKGIKDYLKRKGFSNDIIQNTILKLKSYNLVDDEKFAKNYFESCSSQGKRVIASKLLQKGVSKDIIDELLETVEEDDEIEKAKVLAEKFAKNRQKDPKNKQKCLAHLIYKGYDYGIAQKVTNEIFKNTGEDYVGF